MGLSGFPQGLQTPALDLSLVFYKSRKPNNLNLDLWKPYTPHPQTMNPKPFTLEPKALSQKGRGARVPVVPGGARLLLRTSFCLPLAWLGLCPHCKAVKRGRLKLFKPISGCLLFRH